MLFAFSASFAYSASFVYSVFLRGSELGFCIWLEVYWLQTPSDQAEADNGWSEFGHFLLSYTSRIKELLRRWKDYQPLIASDTIEA